MPREQITFPRERAYVGSTDKAAPVSEPAPPAPQVSVVWHGDGSWVQLLIDVDREWLRDVVKDADPQVSTISLYTEVLNRNEINKLIRFSRRARDAAYGKDE